MKKSILLLSYLFCVCHSSQGAHGNFYEVFPPELRECVLGIVSRIPLHTPVEVKGGKHGLKFPLSLQGLEPLLREAKGKTVLEVGGASGECAALFVLAGASITYLNDIVPEELEIFTTQIKPMLSKARQKRIKVVRGDIMQILSLPPFDETKFDVIVARNFIHLLTDAKRTSFLSQLNAVSNPGALIHLTAHCGPEHQMRTFPGETRFSCYRFIGCVGGNIQHVFSYPINLSEDKDPLDVRNFPVINLRSPQYEVQVNPSSLSDTQSKESLECFAKSINLVHEAKALGQDFSLIFYESRVNYYRPSDLARLFSLESFEVVGNRWLSMSTGKISSEPPSVDPGSAITVRKK